MNCTKVMKYQLVYADDNVLDFRTCNRVMWNLQKEMSMIANRAVQLYWEFSGFQSNYFKKNGCYPDKYVVTDNLGYSNIRSYIYNVISNEFYKNNMRNVSSLLQLVDKKWKTDSKEYFKGTKSIVNYKSTIPIEIVKDNVRISYDENSKEYFLVVSLMSNKFKKELELKKGFLSFRLATKSGAKDILKRVCDGTYNTTSSKLVYNKGKWFLSLGYNFENNSNNQYVADRIMGVDLGIAYPAYLSFNNISDRTSIDGGEIEHFRKEQYNRQLSLLKATKYGGNGSTGHGRNQRTKGAYKASDKVARFRDTVNHKYSRYIVDYAVKHNCGVIQMEDLSGISENSAFLKSWPYYDLQSKIEYKAKEVGIVVNKINPKYTSQRCSKCGYIDKENRQTQKEFVCKKCGFSTNADYNASQNIAIKDIDKIIPLEIESQKGQCEV